MKTVVERRHWRERLGQMLGESVIEVVDVIAFVAIPSLEYRSSWDGEQRVSSPRVAAVVIGPDGQYDAAPLSELRRVTAQEPESAR